MTTLDRSIEFKKVLMVITRKTIKRETPLKEGYKYTPFSKELLDSWCRLHVKTGLFETMEQWSKEQDCYYAILVSGMIRERAHHFYEKMGYTKEAGFRKYY